MLSILQEVNSNNISSENDDVIDFAIVNVTIYSCTYIIKRCVALNRSIAM